jgi:hypothetical protein
MHTVYLSCACTQVRRTLSRSLRAWRLGVLLLLLLLLSHPTPPHLISPRLRSPLRASAPLSAPHNQPSPAQHRAPTDAMSALSPADEGQLQAQLQAAVLACSERCLYHSAKWCVCATSGVAVSAACCGC